MGFVQIGLRIILAITAMAGFLAWSVLFSIYSPRPLARPAAVACGLAYCFLLIRKRSIGKLHIALWIVAIAPLAALLWWICFGPPIRLF